MGVHAWRRTSSLVESSCRHPELQIAELPGVQELHVIAGDFCYLAKVRAGSMAELHDIINDAIPSSARPSAV